MTPEQIAKSQEIMKKMKRDPRSIVRYRDVLLSAGVIPDELTDEEVVERTARLIVVVIEVGRKLKPLIDRITASANIVIEAVHQAEQNSPAFAALMATERQRMER